MNGTWNLRKKAYIPFKAKEKDHYGTCHRPEIFR